MLNVTSRLEIKLTVTLILIGCIFAITAPAAFAYETLSDKNKDVVNQPAPTGSAASSAEVKPAPVAAEARTLTVVKTIYDITLETQPAAAASAKPEARPVASINPVSPGFKIKLAAVVATKPPAVSTAPMTAGEKFNYFVKRQFLSPSPYALSIVSGMFNEIIDNDHDRHMSAGDFIADSGTRAARSFAFRTTAGFFEKFAYPAIFRQDPRYHRSGKSGTGAKIGYAVSRLFITQGDRGGDQPNISFLAGGLTAAGISNVWEREERRTVAKTFSRWGTHLYLTALTNILREFIGGQ